MLERAYRGDMREPRYAWNVMDCIQTMWDANPQARIREKEWLGVLPTDSVVVLEQNSARPAVVAVKGEEAIMLFLSGTSGLLHTEQLVRGWNNPYAATDGTGVCPAFQNGGVSILDAMPNGWMDPGREVRVCGYSYGAAVGQWIALFLQDGLRYPLVSCMSVGSPRSGTTNFQRRMDRVNHYRWFAENDPVRFMPPHIDEVPAGASFLLPSLWLGMNSQVQARTGIQIQDDGNITYQEGNPTRLHAVLFSIVSWITDAEGFRSVNHAADTYMHRFSRAIDAGYTPPRVVPEMEPERPLVVNLRQAQVFIDQGVADAVADPAATLAAGQAYAVERVARGNASLYRRRKVGRVWTVQLRGEVVAIGPGKRKAGTIARQLNRASRD